MKIESKNLTNGERRQVWLWLVANGCRWNAPADSPILVHGRWIIVECYPMRTGQKPTPQQWRQWVRADRIPTRTRRFRNRVPLHLGRS